MGLNLLRGNGYGNTHRSNNGWGSGGAGWRGDGTLNYIKNIYDTAKSFKNGSVGSNEAAGPGSIRWVDRACVGAPGGFGGGGSGADACPEPHRDVHPAH